jgi:acetyl/propionyl-CoA carboxylase alpha subunit
MIASLLIANRGEIARRIIRTATRLGIRTIAIYSDADAGAPHVREADAAVAIGPAPARDSYLVAKKILAAAGETGAQAIHPGYGFLSENEAFAKAVIKAGLVWVGPPPAAIRAMGLKDAAKALMAKAGVPVTPGYLGEDQSDSRLLEEAKAIGFPVLIKAVAGGGGKGMRKVDQAADFKAALESAKREAAASFGNDRVLIEKYAENPRHIEVQVFADRHGNAVHLFERDCSLQRRHQKVIEEAPAPGMDAKTRDAVCAAAVKAARAVKYEGAGTVEFIADASKGLRPDRIWFMEMNTRLQVEHPVTESITGLDLVEWQLRVASGEPLPLAQDQITMCGHAIEARLYAENPQTGFLPSTGPLTHLRLPDTIRVDSAVEQGGEVSPYYDPMIAKLISAAPSRAAAAAKLAEACRVVEIWPVKANAAFLARCLDHPDFIAGSVNTGFIEAHRDQLLPSGDVPADVLAAAARTRLNAVITKSGPSNDSPWRALPGFRLNAPASVDIRLQGDEGVHDVRLSERDGSSGPNSVTIGDHLIVFKAGDAYAFEPARAAGLDAEAATGDGAVRAPMPGTIVAVHAKAGDTLAKGQALIVLEAMKMEYALNAPFAGKLAALSAKLGDQVAEGTILACLEAKA